MMQDSQVDSPDNSTTPVDDSGAILGALTYLRQSAVANRPFAIITGTDPKRQRDAIARFVDEHFADQVAEFDEPLSDPQEFYASMLEQFGFETFDGSLRELESLLRVYLQHEAQRDRRAVVTVQQTQQCGPAVLRAIQMLADLDNNGRSPVMFVLCGLPSLNRVIDSPGMLSVSARADQRFDLDAGESHGARLLAVDCASALGDDTQPMLLVSLDGKLVARYPLGDGQILIGRHEHNDIPVASRYVSRHHAVLVNRPEGAYIVDLKSTNGTRVNGEPITQYVLQTGDIIAIGDFRLKYVNPGAPGRPPADAVNADPDGDTQLLRAMLDRDAGNADPTRLMPVDTDPK